MSVLTIAWMHESQYMLLFPYTYIPGGGAYTGIGYWFHISLRSGLVCVMEERREGKQERIRVREEIREYRVREEIREYRAREEIREYQEK